MTTPDPTQAEDEMRLTIDNLLEKATFHTLHELGELKKIAYREFGKIITKSNQEAALEAMPSDERLDTLLAEYGLELLLLQDQPLDDKYDAKEQELRNIYIKSLKETKL